MGAAARLDSIPRVFPGDQSSTVPVEGDWRSERLIALRGASSVVANERDAILSRTTELLEAIMERNALRTSDLVSAIFTVTGDLNAEFPAVAARELGFDQVPLLCAQEIPVPGSLPLVVRVLLHAYAPPGHRAQHVYLYEARALRADLEAAQ